MHSTKAYDPDDMSDGMDDPQETAYDYYGDDDGAEEGPAAEEDDGAAVGEEGVVVVVQTEQAKAAAAAARRVQREAEARARDRAEEQAAGSGAARAWLEGRGVVCTGLEEDAVRLLHAEMVGREEQLMAELRGIQGLEGVRVYPEQRRCRVNRVPGLFFGVEASIGYPQGSAPVVVDTGSGPHREALETLVRRTAQRGSAGLMSAVVRLCGSVRPPPTGEVATRPAAEEVAQLWQEQTGEAIDLHALRHEVEVTATAEERARPTRAATVDYVGRAEMARVRAQAKKNGHVMRGVSRPSVKSLMRNQRGAFQRSENNARVGIIRQQRGAMSDLSSRFRSATFRVRRNENPVATTDAVKEAADQLAMKMVRISDDEGINTLQFSSPYLGAIPVAIEQFTHLAVLDFSGCGLSTVPPLGAMQLQKLYLSRNAFEVFPEALLADGVRLNLRVLDMSHNRLRELPRELGEFLRLELMLFDYNAVRELPPLEKLVRLEVVEFTDNALRIVPPAVAHLPRLWRLRVGANPILNVPPYIYFGGMEAIRTYLMNTGLYVPPSGLAEDVVRLQMGGAPPEGGCDVVLATSAAGDGLEAAACSVLLEARLPGLVATGADRAKELEDGAATGVTHRLVLPAAAAGAEWTSGSLGLLLRLAAGSLSKAELEAAGEEAAAALSAHAAAFGTAGLRRALAAVERGAGLVAGAALESDLEAYVGTGLAADDGARVGSVVTIWAGERRFRAHRHLLAARCPYFESMFASGMTEETSGEVYLPEVEADVFEGVLSFVYAGTCEKMGPENVVALLFLAAEYRMERLRAMAECMVGYNVEVENVAQILQMAHLLDSANLKKVCYYHMDANQAAVRSTPSYHELQPELKEEFRAGLWRHTAE